MHLLSSLESKYWGIMVTVMMAMVRKLAKAKAMPTLYQATQLNRYFMEPKNPSRVVQNRAHIPRATKMKAIRPSEPTPFQKLCRLA